jgi:hypothetical protein
MNIVKITTLAFLVISFASCKRDYADSPNKAPVNIAATPNFTCSALTSDMPSIDFSLVAGVPISFAATFNETVTWKIELIGQTSTAKKTISGTSSSINAMNSAWYGNHDGLFYFESGENVTANLIVSGREQVCASTSFAILGVRDAITDTPTFMLVDKYADMENIGAVYPYQFSIFPPPPTSPFLPNYKLQDSIIQAPQGQRYLRLEGSSTAANGIFVGGVQCRINPAANQYFLPTTWTDPTKIYLNVFVRGMDKLPENDFPFATLSFECHEDDNMNMSTAANCQTYNDSLGANPDNFCPSGEDAWVYQVQVQHIGWKLFSCRYSDLLPSADIANGGSGNRKLEPQKLARVQLGLLSNPQFHRVSVDVDYVCFTYGAPLDPTK